ncbi:hypothetical protein [Pseudomonas sp. S1_E04]
MIVLPIPILMNPFSLLGGAFKRSQTNAGGCCKPPPPEPAKPCGGNDQFAGKSLSIQMNIKY